MCVVSAVMDNWEKTIPNRWPWANPVEDSIWPPQVTKQEFDDLKKEVESLKKVLIAAKEFDEETDQPNCEMKDKVELIKKIADLVGVNVTDVFGEKK